MTKLIIFQATGEVRRAKPGEWYENIRMYGRTIEERQSDRSTSMRYPIYTRHEIEATPDVLRALGMEGKG
jgi:hypothetical protein